MIVYSCMTCNIECMILYIAVTTLRSLLLQAQRPSLGSLGSNPIKIQRPSLGSIQSVQIQVGHVVCINKLINSPTKYKYGVGLDSHPYIHYVDDANPAYVPAAALYNKCIIKHILRYKGCAR
jgi:hypothetical protein